MTKDLQIVWPVTSMHGTGLRYPLTPQPDNPYYEFEIRLCENYVYPTSELIDPFREAPECECGESLEFDEDINKDIFSSARIRFACPSCGKEFDPSLLLASVRNGWTGDSIGPIPGGACHRFAIVVDCGKCLPERECGAISFNSDLVDLCRRALGCEFHQVICIRITRQLTGAMLFRDLPMRSITLAVWLLSATSLLAQPREVPWSFSPIAHPQPPSSKFDQLSANPIDRFLFARMAEKGLQPSAPATRLALLRRATVDLTGLLPTPEEVAAFLEDDSPQAFEKVVDRLLASSAYGERWARHWLDVVRYGESHGYEQNHLRANAWPYRDYVIRSFNEDKPYAQFLAEQLAGDVLSQGDPNIEVATGFLVAGVHDTVGIQNIEGQLQQRVNDLEDIVSTVGAAFLGLTVGCARCHDHKFDPIPHKDFYRLAAVFAGVRHAERPLSRKSVESDASVAAARELRALQGQVNDLDALARLAVLKEQGAKPVPRPAVNGRRNVDDFAPVVARFVRFLVLKVKNESEPCLDEFEVYGPGSANNLALASSGGKATASSLLPGYPIHQVAHLNDGRYGNEWSWISNQRGGGWAQIELARPAKINRVVWSRDATDPARYVDRVPVAYRIEVSEDGNAWSTVSTDAGRAPASEAIPSDVLLKNLTVEQRAERARLVAQIEKLRTKASSATLTTAYIGQFNAPDAIHLLRRGDVMQKKEIVEPGPLSLGESEPTGFKVDGKLGEAGRRLALARWLTDAANPLTARVMVNRIWQHHFGRGLVATPSDFGNNGSKPSHPELLDWLASDFQEHGWKLKRLHKQMVMSYAYQQTSSVNKKGEAIDADNIYLWRMPLRRLEAEALRDAILQVSGKLDRTMGGPSFRLFKYNVVNIAIYEPLDVHGPETWRRSIYATAARAIRDDLMGNFDLPECSQRNPRRDVTTTPLQALSLMNGSFAVQQAGFLADRVHKHVGDDAGDQARQAFRLAFGREPSDAERTAALRLIAAQGLPALCRALLSANEFVYY